MELEELLSEIKKYPECTHLVLTWGEPSMFQKHIQELRDHLPQYTFEIETNGSRALDPNLFDQVNVSYKLKSSGNDSYEMMPTPEWALMNDVAIDYKFVCGWQEDLDEILALINAYDIDEKLVYLMPLGTTIESQTTSENAIFVSEACKKHWFKFCLRMHILLYGNKMWV